MLHLNGSGFSKYLTDYYRYEYADLFEYANSEYNRYVVCYRAYLNNTPTDDIIYVHFSPKGVLMSVSAKKCLQYIDIHEVSLTPLDKLEGVIRDELSKMNYPNISLVEKEHDYPCYYTMSSTGELYYVMNWNAFRFISEDECLAYAETMAVKAS